MRAHPQDLDLEVLTFTRNWFRKRNLAAFAEHLIPEFAGKPTDYLEVGVFEGMSFCWMLQRVLTHPESRAVGVDPWLMTTKLDQPTMDGVMTRARNNARWYRPRACLIRGCSAEVLRKMLGRHGFAGIRAGSLDLCMVDGDHNALGVLDDCRLVWRLLKPGGLMICDDVHNDRPKVAHVEDGLRMFLAEVGAAAELAWEWKYGEAWRKTA